jgi:hypothetical protein
MISLIALLGVFGGGAVMSAHYGADSRRNDDRRDW